MPMVPQELDALDRFIEQEERIARLEQGCGATTGGPDSEGGVPPEEPVAPPPAAMTRNILLRASCKKNGAGAVKYPNGTPWQFAGSAGVLEGSGAAEATPATPGTVRINAVLKWNPEGSGALNPTRQVGFPRSLMFKLPPGWWPQRLETFRVPVEAGRGHVEVTPDTGHVYFVPAYGCRPSRVDLTAVMFRAGGGADGQGDGSVDPTGCGDGSPWEGDVDNFNEPAMSVETGGAGAWKLLTLLPAWKEDATTAGTIRPQWREAGDFIELAGVVRRTTEPYTRGIAKELPNQDMHGDGAPATGTLAAAPHVTPGALEITQGVLAWANNGAPEQPVAIYMNGVRIPRAGSALLVV